MARLGNRLVQESTLFSGPFLASGWRRAESSRSERVGVEGEAHQLLAEAVVNVLADAGMLPVADFEDLAFQAVALAMLVPTPM